MKNIGENFNVVCGLVAYYEFSKEEANEILAQKNQDQAIEDAVRLKLSTGLMSASSSVKTLRDQMAQELLRHHELGLRQIAEYQPADFSPPPSDVKSPVEPPFIP